MSQLAVRGNDSFAGSSGFSVPIGESCTNPESKVCDPFAEGNIPEADKMAFTPRGGHDSKQKARQDNAQGGVDPNHEQALGEHLR